MVTLIATVTIAELLMGESALSSDSADADTIARLNVVRRMPR